MLHGKPCSEFFKFKKKKRKKTKKVHTSGVEIDGLADKDRDQASGDGRKWEHSAQHS